MIIAGGPLLCLCLAVADEVVRLSGRSALPRPTQRIATTRCRLAASICMGGHGGEKLGASFSKRRQGCSLISVFVSTCATMRHSSRRQPQDTFCKPESIRTPGRRRTFPRCPIVGLAFQLNLRSHCPFSHHLDPVVGLFVFNMSLPSITLRL